MGQEGAGRARWHPVAFLSGLTPFHDSLFVSPIGMAEKTQMAIIK